jgi:hypothetical protein
MLRYQQFVGPFRAQHLDSHQHWDHYDWMQAVHADCFHRMQIFDRPAILLGDRYIPADISNCPTRLEPTDHVTLLHKAHWRLCVDSSFFQDLQRMPRQPQSHLV